MEAITSSGRPFAADQIATWKSYVDYRPPYPDSMWSLWLKYHQGPLDTAHDVGAGPGVSAIGLLRLSEVKTTILSDPGAESLRFAESILTQAYPNVRFAFKQAPADESWLQPGSVDFVSACECLHWTDIEPSMANIAASLRPGGTFAAVFYLPFPYVNRNARADRALMGFCQEHLARLAAHSSRPIAEGCRNASTGLDFVPLPGGLWQDVRRVEINTELRQEHLESTFGVFGYAKSQVGLDTTEERESWTDTASWSRSSTVEWLKQSLLSIRCGMEEQDFEKQSWKEVERLAEDAGGELELCWHLSIVLARRRGNFE